ncbi:MAG: TRAM domain-containing protein, partial [Candidatus Omnitrophica bacterium]|nr:TRAM domain-containing protein [Candidatus Omnitrophota bacterium]
GAFEYSREEGTPAYSFKGQVPAKQKRERVDQILKTQQKISLAHNELQIGKTHRVLIEKQDEKDPSLFYGRTQMDAPEIDGICFVRSKKKIKIGQFKDVIVTDALEYDLIGESL